MLQHLAEGFAFIANAGSLLAIVAGLLTGIVVGALPGLSATMAVALLSPVTFFMAPQIGIPFLLGLFKAAIYAGSIPAITINTPGTAAAAATCLDGHVLAREGKGRKALEMSLYASVTGDLVSTILLIVAATWLAGIAIRFGPPEFVMLYLLALITISSVSGRHAPKAVLSTAIGFLVASVGFDPMSGAQRFTFGSTELSGGLSFIPILIGLFALSEIFVQLETRSAQAESLAVPANSSGVTWPEFRAVVPTLARSSGIGFFIGLLPGIGAEISTWLAYGSAKRRSRHPERFGKGSLEGVAASESGNNAACPGDLIPMMVFGIPGDAVTAILLGAFIAQGLTPGPLLFEQHGDLVYGLFASLLIGNALLLAIGYLGIRWFRRITDIPAAVLYPVVVALCLAGSFAVNSSVFDVLLTVIAGVVGYAMRKLNMPVAPMVIAMLVAPGLESTMRQSLQLSEGSLLIFVARPISAVLLAFILAGTAFMVWRWLRAPRASLSGDPVS